MITTHGDSFAAKLTPNEKAEYDAGRPVVRFSEVSGLNLCGVYHPHEYVTKVMAKGFELKAFLPVGNLVNIYQDVYLFQKL
ncbi:hypothetical protein OVA03_16915 [Asticcacaulis sp. SL142]|uniref:hypothetical protein n=1 Tax=Asticcacaulis sp. SL142 TaxID=2995155 RepID=UPI00226CD569|nr:hypothetical protein [Asticcacaulis sp. SL142]WAC48348.1 hypothetical protein OVA03_16915 [Asticcacaulis sp. SL142]